MYKYLAYVTEGSGMDLNERFYFVYAGCPRDAFMKVLRHEDKDLDKHYSHGVQFDISSNGDLWMFGDITSANIMLVNGIKEVK